MFIDLVLTLPVSNAFCAGASSPHWSCTQPAEQQGKLQQNRQALIWCMRAALALSWVPSESQGPGFRYKHPPNFWPVPVETLQLLALGKGPGGGFWGLPSCRWLGQRRQRSKVSCWNCQEPHHKIGGVDLCLCPTKWIWDMYKTEWSHRSDNTVLICTAITYVHFKYV